MQQLDRVLLCEAIGLWFSHQTGINAIRFFLQFIIKTSELIRLTARGEMDRIGEIETLL